MAKNRFQLALEAFKNPTQFQNLFNKVIYQFGHTFTSYNQDLETLMVKGYGENPYINAMINQMAAKSTSVPFYIKKIVDEGAMKRIKSYPIEMTYQQKQAVRKLKSLAYETDTEMPMPLERPNPVQTWHDLVFLYKVYLKVCGNVYFYLMSPEDGMNKGVPLQVYMLPAQYVDIVLKSNANLISVESPIDYYILKQGNQYIKFPEQSIIHIKRPNPMFDFSGSHLYGRSELMAAIRNINSSNSGIDLNVKTLQNGGAYGFIHAGDGQTPLTAEQAKELKDRLVEMDNSEAKLSNIAGASAKLGFTRISLTTDEMKPFDYLNNDKRILADCLSWPTELLSEERRGTGFNVDGKIEAKKQAITDNIKPDLDLLASYLNPLFIRKFKGYEKAELEFDISELPEMQPDMVNMAKWVNEVPLTLNERRDVFDYEEIDDEMMNQIYIPNNLVNLNDPNIVDLQNPV